MILRQLVAQGDPQGTTLALELASVLETAQADRLDVAVAYATRSGLKSLRDAIGGWPAATRWVVGLDDAITQPDAIDELIALPNAEVNLASLSSEGRRFHPKLYCFSSSTNPALGVAAIGSANMTLHGLERNGEVGVILVAETAEEAAGLKAAWAEMASLGKDVSQWDLEAYRTSYGNARKARRRMAKIKAIPIQPEAEEELDEAIEEPAEAAAESPEIAAVSSFDGDPATAQVAWTEGASPSAGGRDLEFPRKMMPFFHLTKSPVTRQFRMANGKIFSLTFTMREDNQMWRLLFSREAINAGIGRETLRPVAGGNRSDLAIVFERDDGVADFDVDLVLIGSPEHEKLIAQSRAVNGLDRTRDPGGRSFGYF